MSTGFGIVNTRGSSSGKESTEFVTEVCVCGSIIITPPPKPPDTGSRSAAQPIPVTRFLASMGTPMTQVFNIVSAEKDLEMLRAKTVPRLENCVYMIVSHYLPRRM